MQFWISAIIILLLTALAIFWAIWLRRRRLERKLRLEIINQGNTDCAFQLHAEDPRARLEFRFMKDGNRLPEVVTTGAVPAQSQAAVTTATPVPEGPSGGARAMGFTGALASLLVSIGSILPRSLGNSILQAGTQMSRTQSQATRIQQVSNQAADFARTGGQPSSSPASPVSVEPGAAWGSVWSETPLIAPGTSLNVDLLVRSGWVQSDASLSFLVKSRASNNERSPLVVQDGLVHIRGGFWSHRVYPILLVSGVSLVLLFLAFWFTRV